MNNPHEQTPPVAAAATCSTLTVGILKTLKFDLRFHLNGGSEYSARIVGNDEYRLFVQTETDGSPNYRVVSKKLGVDGAPEIMLDLTAKERDLQGFCDAYNSWVKSSTQPLANGESGGT